MIDILLTNGWLRTAYASLRNLTSQGLSVAVSDSRPFGISQFSNKKMLCVRKRGFLIGK